MLAQLALLLLPPAPVTLQPLEVVPELQASAHLEAPGADAKAYACTAPLGSMFFIDLGGDGTLDAFTYPRTRAVVPLRKTIFWKGKRYGVQCNGTASVTFTVTKQKLPPKVRKVLDDLNAERLRVGLHPVGWHEGTRQACELHAAYMERYPNTQVGARLEAKGFAGYTKAGAGMAAAGVTLRTSAGRAIRVALQTYADRMSLLDPHLFTISGAVSRNGKVVVLDTAYGHARYVEEAQEVLQQPVRWPLAYPRPDSVGAPAGFSGWCIETYGKKRGGPISLRLGPGARDFAFGEAMLTHVSSGKKIDCELSWPGAGFTRLGGGNRNGVGLIPLKRLSGGWYRVEIRYDSQGRSHTHTWKFRVG